MAEMKDLDTLSLELVSKAKTSRDNAIETAKAALQVEIDKKIDSDKLWKNDVFDTTYTHANGSFAHLWNEKDGGGVQYFNNVSKVKSFLGVNDANGKNNGDITVQIYSIDDTDKIGTRININQLGAYYLQGTTNEGTPSGREIAVKGDVANVNAAVSQLQNDIENDFVKTVTAEATYAKKDAVYTKEEVDKLIAEAINTTIANVLETLTNQFSE